MSRPRRWSALLWRRVLPALAVLALLGVSLQLADDAAGGGHRLLPYSPWILGAAAFALFGIAVAIVLRLVRLRRDLARAAPGAQLSRRLLVMLVLLAVPPVVVVYGFSLRFLNATVDTWFNVELESALDDALEVGRIMIEQRLANAGIEMDDLAQRIESLDEAGAQAELDSSIDAMGAIQLSVFGTDHRVLASASSDPRYLQPPLPDAQTLMRVQGGGRYAAAEPLGDELALRVVLPLARDARRGARLLQGLFPLPPRLQPLTRNIEDASFDFQQLKFLRGSLKLTFALILSFVLLLSVLIALLAAFGVARRLVAPVGRLVAATRAVGAGRYDTPLPVASNDELGFLVSSFGQMTRELELASARAQRGAEEVEQQRAWLGAVLERLSAGVLGFDQNDRLRVANRRHLSDAVIATGIKTQGTSNDTLQLRQLGSVNPAVAGIRRSGSISVDMAWLAAGRFDALWEAGLKPWDVAPGLLMVREAGGLVSDFAGQPGSVWNGQIVAGNETLQGALLKTLRAIQ